MTPFFLKHHSSSWKKRIAFQSRIDLTSFMRQTEIWKSDLCKSYNALEKDLVALTHSQSTWKTLIPPSTAGCSNHHWAKGHSMEMRGESAGLGIRESSPIQALPFLSRTPAWACLPRSLSFLICKMQLIIDHRARLWKMHAWHSAS